MAKRAPTSWYDFSQDGIKRVIRALADCINEIADGRLNSSGVITLTASAATTAVTDRRVGRDSVILFMPVTANAAAELAAGTMYVQTTDIAPLTNQFTINHANNAQADRTFRYLIAGSEIT
ncbi:MAG: hypothetical protein A2Z55_01235 [Burkholderiales bacterium RIFCSPHIGHO2_12_63_9]|nr:MAG: hypothetical protein UY96_C0015G0013 [Parcubacteria group bacterium GW2011_GWB1_56_8]OGA97101.1 MAG: hypothetical protein A2Z55_01235 [Burkholderiales bacterium RIFCSPHIGHO2_12_63_9]